MLSRVKRGVENPMAALTYVLDRLSPTRYYYDLQQTNVYERNWDVLPVLDACCVDTLQEVTAEYDFLPEEIKSIISVGAGSPDWMTNTFEDDYLDEVGRTAYVSANPHAKRVLGSTMEGRHAERGGSKDRTADFESFVPLWEHWWDNDAGTVPARPVTDYIIDFCRSDKNDRVIAHYMQPHFPSIPNQLGEGMVMGEDTRWASGHTWSMVGTDISTEDAYESYVENLRYVLDDVKLLLSNLDAERVIITADHGNAFGELGQFGHEYKFLSCVREVPWVKVSATDDGNYEPDVNSELPDGHQDPSADEKLRVLGYKT